MVSPPIARTDRRGSEHLAAIYWHFCPSEPPLCPAGRRLALLPWTNYGQTGFMRANSGPPVTFSSFLYFRPWACIPILRNSVYVFGWVVPHRRAFQKSISYPLLSSLKYRAGLSAGYATLVGQNDNLSSPYGTVGSRPMTGPCRREEGKATYRWWSHP